MATFTPLRHPPGFTHPLTAADGYPLQATVYAAQGPLQARLVVAGATGVPQGFYARFAQFAAQQGVEVWTLDYRGIGGSRPPKLRGFEMDYLDWARLDLAAAVEHVANLGAEPLWMVGHSYGGHAFGLLPEPERVARLVTFATGAGWHGWMPRRERWRVWLMWRVLGPLLVRTRGYLAWSLLGMGEDLPRSVFYQWRHWCQWPRYFLDDPERPELAQALARVRTPIWAINATDDAWATAASRDAFMAGYANAPVQVRDLSPSQLGVQAVGHMGYFRPFAAPLWQEALDWLRSSQPG